MNFFFFFFFFFFYLFVFDSFFSNYNLSLTNKLAAYFIPYKKKTKKTNRKPTNTKKQTKSY